MLVCRCNVSVFASVLHGHTDVKRQSVKSWCNVAKVEWQLLTLLLVSYSTWHRQPYGSAHKILLRFLMANT